MSIATDEPKPTPRGTARELVPVGSVMAVALAAAAIAAWSSGNQEFVFYLVVLVLLMAVIAACHLSLRLSQGVLYCLAAWAILHLAGGLVSVPESWPIAGEMRVLYSWWLIPGYLKYDQVVHAYGFGVTTWLCWQCISRITSIVRPRFGLLVIAALAGQGLGALNEVVEFFATLLVPETNVGGYMNTGWDLVANLLGSFVAAIVIHVTYREDPNRKGRAVGR